MIIFSAVYANQSASASSSDEHYILGIFDYVVDSCNSSCFCSIQEAINSADPYASIFINDGVYHEPIVVSKPVTLVGQSIESTCIDCCSTENGYALSITSSYVVIRNLRISNHGPGLYTTGIKCSAPNCCIQNSTIQDTPIGIAIWSSDIVVEGCLFVGCADEGIAVLGSSSRHCDSIQISDCVFRDNCDGIEIQHGSNMVISSCVFSNNSHAGVDMISENNHDIDVVDSCFFAHPGYGLFISQTFDMNVRNCSFSDSVVEIKNSVKTWFRSCTNVEVRKDSLSSVVVTRFSDMVSFITSKFGGEDTRHPFLLSLLEFLDDAYRAVC